MTARPRPQRQHLTRLAHADRDAAYRYAQRAAEWAANAAIDRHAAVHNYGTLGAASEIDLAHVLAVHALTAQDAAHAASHALGHRDPRRASAAARAACERARRAHDAAQRRASRYYYDDEDGGWLD